MPHDSPLDPFTFHAEDHQADTFSQTLGPDTHGHEGDRVKSLTEPAATLKTPRTFMLKSCFFVAVLLAFGRLRAAETNNSAQDWVTRPLSLGKCIDIALKQNSAILKGQSDLEAAYGVVVQTRAIAIPKLRATGNYEFNNALESFQLPPPAPSITFQQEQSWSAGLRVEQSIYEGGRIRSSLKTARLTKEQAIFDFQRVVADTLVEERIA